MELEQELKSLKSSLEGKTTSEIKSAIESFEGKTKTLISDAVKESNEKLKAEFEIQLKASQDHIDGLDIRIKESHKAKKAEMKSIGQAISEAIEEKADDIAKIRRGDDYTIKVVGTMTTAANLTGDPVATYNTRQGIIPSQAINFRDLIPTVQSSTGLYVTYRETGSEGAFDWQTTEGAKKSQLDYDFTEVKLVNNFLAGTVDFSRQMMTNLPWLQTGLNRMLQRDFFKKENDYFYDTLLAAATGPSTTAYTVAVEQLTDVLMKFRDTNFIPSYIVMNNATFSTLALTKPMDYSTPFIFGYNPVTRLVEIDGVPVIRVSWATTGKAMIFDADYVERVEVVGMNLRFSDQNKDNFEKNLITARLECQEELNILLTGAASDVDLTVTT